MKWMIASDLHGSFLYTKQLFLAYAAEKADKLILLGDYLYHGPRNRLPDVYEPQEVISLLNAHKDSLLCVRGNCDAEVDQMVLDFPIMADYMSIIIDGHTIFATHGHLYGENNPPPLQTGDILLTGHTHIPAIRQKNGYLYVNPGSVSLPKENHPRTYMILEDGFLSLKNLNREVIQKEKIY